MMRFLVPVTCLAVLVVMTQSAPAGEPAPRVEPVIRIVHPSGGQTRERKMLIDGTVTGIKSERLTLVLNGVTVTIPRKGDTFSTTQVLAPGWNHIRVASADGTKVVQDDVAVFARVPRKELRVTLTWDTPGTDMDLWVTGPDGERVFYSNKQGKAGGTLDVDVTDGYGPETYTQARLQPGTYRIQVHFYGGGKPTRATATVIQNEGTPDESRRTKRGILLKSGEMLEIGEFSVGG